MSIQNALSVPIYFGSTQLCNKKLKNSLEKELFRPYYEGLTHSLPYLHENPDFQDLVLEIEKHYNLYMQELEQPLHSFKIVSMWANLFQGGGSIHHFHSNSYISGVYVVKQSEKPAATIFTSMHTEMLRLEEKLIPDCKAEIAEGSLIMFPSFVHHLVEPCTDRITISWNILPTELGGKYSLNNATLFE